jgi:iron complex outermembrane receptor protein
MSRVVVVGGARRAQASKKQGWGRNAAALALVILAASPAAAQEATTELPTIEVTTPSPVVKPKKAKRATSGGAAQVTETDAGEPPPGTTLDFGDQAFVPVTVVTERQIAATNGPTITDSLDTRPGIYGTNFAPGANRPIIRGLDSYRVRTQENGIGTHDVAAISEDHAVPIDPNAADRVEVVRGPATLRYGSQAIGGVVSVENERIPTFIPDGGVSAAIKGGVTSVDEGRDGAFKVTAGSKATGFAVHADGFARRVEDYDTPKGKELNSFVDSQGGSVGISRVWQDGFVGVAFARIESLYGVPGEEAREGVAPRIDMEQDKVLARGEWRLRDYGLEAVRFWFGASDYAHDELAIHDPDHEQEFEIGSTFTNKEQEARVELQHLPTGTALGTLNGAFGVHVVNRKTRGQSFEGESLLEPAHTQSAAAFWFEELDVTRSLRLQAAARIEHAAVDGSGWREFEEDPADPDHFVAEGFAGERSFTPLSGSVGLLHALPFQTVGRLTGQYVERAPDAAELFSKGMHEATGTFEVGNPGLDVEKATTVEVGLKRDTGALRFDAAAYYTRYNGFIYRQLAGRECGAEAEAGGEFHCEEEGHGGGGHGGGHDHEHAFDLVFFDQRDAHFYGLELGGQYDVAPIWRGVWGIDGQYDFVRAEFDGGENVPRIPPHRLGGGLYYRDANWYARAGLLHAFDQNEIGAEEIATPGYTLVSAEISYTVEGDARTPGFTIGLKGENLGDDEVLNHASFKRREDVLESGASVRVFGSVRLN